MTCRTLQLIPNISSLLMSFVSDVQCGLVLVSMQWPSAICNLLKSPNTYFPYPETLTQERKDLQIQNFGCPPNLGPSQPWVYGSKRMAGKWDLIIHVHCSSTLPCSLQLLINYSILIPFPSGHTSEKLHFRNQKDWSIQWKGFVF